MHSTVITDNSIVRSSSNLVREQVLIIPTTKGSGNSVMQQRRQLALQWQSYCKINVSNQYLVRLKLTLCYMLIISGKKKKESRYLG